MSASADSESVRRGGGKFYQFICEKKRWNTSVSAQAEWFLRNLCKQKRWTTDKVAENGVRGRLGASARGEKAVIFARRRAFDGGASKKRARKRALGREIF